MAFESLEARMRRLRYEEPAPDFSRREKEILTMLVDGKTNKEMAEAIHRTVKNVELIMSSASKKLAVHLGEDRTRVQVALWVARHPASVGLPTPPLLKELVGFLDLYLVARQTLDYKDLDDWAVKLIDRAKAITV